MVGSFNPVDHSDWSSGAYVVPGSPLQNIYIARSTDSEDGEEGVLVRFRTRDRSDSEEEVEFRSADSQTVEEENNEWTTLDILKVYLFLQTRVPISNLSFSNPDICVFDVICRCTYAQEHVDEQAV